MQHLARRSLQRVAAEMLVLFLHLAEAFHHLHVLERKCTLEELAAVQPAPENEMPVEECAGFAE